MSQPKRRSGSRRAASARSVATRSSSRPPSKSQSQRDHAPWPRVLSRGRGTGASLGFSPGSCAAVRDSGWGEKEDAAVPRYPSPATRGRCGGPPAQGQRKQRQAGEEGWDRVADVYCEADRGALGACGAEGGEDVGEHAEQGHAAHPAQDARSAPERAVRPPAIAPSDDQRPEGAESLVQARLEVLAPDAGVGRVVDDREVWTAGLQSLRMRQRDRPQMLQLRQWVAGDDQVAQVPVAAAGKSCRKPPSGGRPATSLRSQDDDSQRQRRSHRECRRLRTDCEADCESRYSQREHFGRQPRKTRSPFSVDKDRDRGQQ